MNIPKMIEDYEIIKMEKETEKALFYSCKDKTGEHCLIKFYKKNKKPKLNSLAKIHNANAIEILKEGKIFDTDTSKHFDYEIMPYLENVTRLSEQTPLSENEAFEIIKKIAECLNEFHKNGFIHRNITPENILMKDSEPILISYGSVTEIDLQDDVDVSLTKIFKDKEDVTGTEGFIAPEVYTGVISPAVDYYCLGMTLYLLLTGKALYEEVKPNKFKTLLFLGKLNDQVNKNPILSVKQKRLICGLITIQHDKRWAYDEISRFLNGKDVPVYTDWEPPKPFIFGFKKYFDVQLLSENFLKHPIIAEKLIRGGKFTKYLLQFGLTGRAKQINKLLKDKGTKYSAQEICSLVYLELNDMTYNLCPGKHLKTKDDLFSLSEQLQKRIEYLVLSKEITFKLWLTGIFDVNMKAFYSILEGDEDYAKSVSVNKLRHEKGLWPLLVEFLKTNEINIKAESLGDVFFEANINKIIRKTHCSEFRKNENVFLAGKEGKYKVFNLIEGKTVLTKIFTKSWPIHNGYILGNENGQNYIVKQKGRKTVIQSLTYKKISRLLNNFILMQDYKELNALISVVVEYNHLNGGDPEYEKQILSFVDINHLESLSPFAKLFYYCFLYLKLIIDKSNFIKIMESIYDYVDKSNNENPLYVMNEMGKIYYQLNKKKEAQKCFEKGLCGNFTNIMINEIALAELYYEQKQYKEALSYYRVCKDKKSDLIYNNPTIYKNFVNCTSALGLHV